MCLLASRSWRSWERHTLDETLSETDTINENTRVILDVQTEEWGIKGAGSR